MKKIFKKLSVLVLSASMVFALAGCSNSNLEKKYQTYIKSLIAINYLGATEDYIEATGANQEDADALYESNIDMLTDNILTYYGITITDAPELREGYSDLSKNIYSKVNYSVSKAYKDGSVYLVDVTIYPIDLFSQTGEEVSAYVDKFNTGVKNGDYNDYTLSEYETVFSTGMLEILDEGCLNMTYAQPVTVTVEIVNENDMFYISDRDFMKIDAAMISTDVTTPVSTDSDAE
jgi:hypothetical protein